MRWSDQGVETTRYHVIPRTLCFLFYENRVLLLRGADDKRLWAGRLNGIGGHVEPGEDLLVAARREIAEEAGITDIQPRLCGIIHASPSDKASAGIILFVFAARIDASAVTTTRCGREGDLEWHSMDDLPHDEMVADLPHLLPRVWRCLDSAGVFYGLYTADTNGEMVFYFSNAGDALPAGCSQIEPWSYTDRPPSEGNGAWQRPLEGKIGP